MRFDGKTALVTGAGRGIGRAVALRLSAEGADVACVDLSEPSARDTVALMGSDAGRSTSFGLDVSDVDAVNRVANEITASLGSIDILVNSAGIVRSEPFLDVTPESWDRIIDINQRGTAFMMQAVARRMIERVPRHLQQSGAADRCYGKIVNFSSISGRRGRSYQLHYAASKAAVISLTQSAALALAPYGINVNAICPSVVRTPMWEEANRGRASAAGVDPQEAEREFIARIPLGRAGTPEEMASAVAFLCSSEADFITGQTLNVDGGYEMD